MLTITKATPDHAALLAELEKASFSDPWSEASLRSFLSEPHALVLLAQAEGGCCGYLVASLLGEEGELMRIAVLPALRGRGTGRQLLGAFRQEAASRGVGSLFLEVREANGPARALYESEGFTLLGRRKNYYREPTEDAILYQYTII